MQSRQDETGRWRLLRGADRGKDQSYFLFSLTQAQLARAIFPVGHMDKPSVRAYASERQLPVANKPDSQEICFVPDGDQAAFVARAAGDRAPHPGRIVDSRGRRSAGTTASTTSPSASARGCGLSVGVPLYVVAIDAGASEVVVGPRSALEARHCTVQEVNWVSGRVPEAPLRVECKSGTGIRRRRPPCSRSAPDAVAVEFDAPQYAITPGQAAVFYDGDEVIGGGWITKADGSAMLAELDLMSRRTSAVGLCPIDIRHPASGIVVEANERRSGARRAATDADSPSWWNSASPSSSQRSASMAAMQPVPADVIAWR